MRQRRTKQLELSFPNGWGGARRNAGRKRSPDSKTPHRARPLHHAREPVHVTLKGRLAVLRSQFVFPTLRLAVGRAARRAPERFRVIDFSAQRDHLHLIVEAEDTRTLSSGVRGLAVRIARYVNDLLGRHGSFWGDRWHGRALRTPREVRNVLVYVLGQFSQARAPQPARGARSVFIGRVVRRLARMAARFRGAASACRTEILGQQRSRERRKG